MLMGKVKKNFALEKYPYQNRNTVMKMDKEHGTLFSYSKILSYRSTNKTCIHW